MSKKSLYTGEWSGIDCTCDILDKNRSIYNYVMLMFDRTNQMFEYSGLPDTIPAYMLELYLQISMFHLRLLQKAHLFFTDSELLKRLQRILRLQLMNLLQKVQRQSLQRKNSMMTGYSVRVQSSLRIFHARYRLRQFLKDTRTVLFLHLSSQRDLMTGTMYTLVRSMLIQISPMVQDHLRMHLSMLQM